MMDLSSYNPEGLRTAAPVIFAVARRERSTENLRRRLCAIAEQMEYDTFMDYGNMRVGSIIRVRDCARNFRNMLQKRSEDLAGFSILKAIRDIAQNRPRLELQPAFYADLRYLLLGMQGVGPGKAPADDHLDVSHLQGREAAIERSRQLDLLWQGVEDRLKMYTHGLEEGIDAYRKERIREVLAFLGGDESDWLNWNWHADHVIRDADTLHPLVTLREWEREGIQKAVEQNVPFGITPFYVSLMDRECSERDHALRAQVIPNPEYVKGVVGCRRIDGETMDFMREQDTSPVELVTRRYPAVIIFKPYNTCPQICVYCQRNWEIDEVLAPDAKAPMEDVDEALEWMSAHPSIHEVLLTGGDPLGLPDRELRDLIDKIAKLPSVERIRIGTRTPVTMPMRFTEALCSMLGSYRIPGKRDVTVVTHIQHPYELNQDTLEAADRIRRQGISILNQLVYTFFISRRFEAVALRRILCLAGISPYYTFNTKGKEETDVYRVPIARLLQEQKEEARLMPGVERTDEAVYNVPGMGKNYLRARQHRSILSILPDGARVYEYHPWEKSISGTGPLETYITRDVPLLAYLERLEALGEQIVDYQTIWYYY